MKNLVFTSIISMSVLLTPLLSANEPKFLPAKEDRKVTSYAQSIEELESAITRIENTPHSESNIALIQLLDFHLERSKLYLQGGWFSRSQQSIERAQYILRRYEASI